jgi:hypothetical protein
MVIAALLVGFGATSVCCELSLDRCRELASQTFELAPLSV